MTTASEFQLDARLAEDTVLLGDFALCRVLMMNDSHYPWCVLVPRINGLREVYELGAEERTELIHESCQLGKTIMEHFGGDKLNVAALGNQVAQLHLHHVVRYRNDAAWPAPVWGVLAPQPYLPDDLLRTCDSVANRLEKFGLKRLG